MRERVSEEEYLMRACRGKRFMAAVKEKELARVCLRMCRDGGVNGVLACTTRQLTNTLPSKYYVGGNLRHPFHQSPRIMENAGNS